MYFLCFVICILFGNAVSRDLNDCPDTSRAVEVVFDKEVSTFVVGSQVCVRIPDDGLLQNPITCISVTDNRRSDNTPEVQAGGVGYPYAVVSVYPRMTELLSYRVVAFVDPRYDVVKEDKVNGLSETCLDSTNLHSPTNK
ncbi:uncharacterized protein LOC114325742 [Diabrotica virgifera virgifera]|uniref:Uncharacterized protein n=1 Tax=Diabrotica virgifera virgifera TaxID=50390 RepID=A0ABM5KQ31_DIAVI|nr:uncharacterized protein LOC114325742 [Diabrotica virgifera virgifera]